MPALFACLVGKRVKITTTETNTPVGNGICEEVIPSLYSEYGEFDIKLKDGNKYTFIPEKITPTGVEANLGPFNAGQRIIEIVF